MTATAETVDNAAKLRDILARRVFERANDTVERTAGIKNEMIAGVMKTARENVVRLSAIRALTPAREQQRAAELRQERVARTLRDARDTCARLAGMQAPPRRPAQTVYKTKTDARRPEAPRPPSPAPSARKAAPQDEATSYYDVCREAIVEFIVENLDQERARWQREIDGLQRQVDGLVRELDLVHRQLRQSS